MPSLSKRKRNQMSDSESHSNNLEEGAWDALPGDSESYAVDMTKVVDKMAATNYEDLDSHYPQFTWTEYKQEDPEGAEALYLMPARKAVMKAAPQLVEAFGRQRELSKGLTEPTELEPLPPLMRIGDAEPELTISTTVYLPDGRRFSIDDSIPEDQIEEDDGNLSGAVISLADQMRAVLHARALRL